MRNIGLLGLALTLAGCAAVPHLAEPATPLSAIAASQSLGDGQGAWPTDGWWSRYGDPQLDSLMTEALSGSPTLKAAAARVAKADALAQQAGAALLPQAGLDAGASYAKQSYNNGIPVEFVPKDFHANSRIAASVDWSPDIWGRAHDALASATSEALAARADAAQARLILTAGLATAYNDLARLFAERDDAVTALKIRQDMLAIMQQRQAQALENGSAVDREWAAERAAAANLAAADQAIAVARAQIAALVGAGPDRGSAVQRPTLHWNTMLEIPAGASTDLIARRPDVAASLARVEAAAAQVKVARKDFYPSIALTGLGGYQSLDIKTLFKGGSEIGSLGVAVHLPIFDGGQLSGAYRGARADYDAAVADYDGTVLAAYQQAANSVVARTTVARQLDQLTAAYDASARAYDVAKARYSQHITSFINVLTAQDALVQAGGALAAIRARTISTDIDLVRALGGGYSQAAPAAHATAGGTDE